MRWLSSLTLHTLGAGVLLLVAFLGSACGRSGRRPVTATPAPLGTFLVVVEEHDDNADVWLIDPQNLANRKRIANVPHRSGWDLRATLSPDGSTLVYDVLPRTAVDPDTQGELWTIALASPKARRLATGVDLRSSLVWSPDASWVTYERVKGSDEIEVRRVNAAGAGDQLLARSQAGVRWFPMGYSADGGSVLLARLTANGTQVVRVAPGAAPGDGVQIATGPSRGFTVGPDGRWALLALMDENGRKVYRAITSQPGGAVARLTAGGQEDTGIAWNPRTNEPTVGVVPAAPGDEVPAAAGSTVVVPRAGFDVPVAWSPDGRLLVVSHFSGDTTDKPDSETLQIIGPDGHRDDLTGSGPLTFAGWAARS
jgi:hypothetical protein